MGNIPVQLFLIRRCHLKYFLSTALAVYTFEKVGLLCNFGRGHYGEHFCENIFKFGSVIQKEMSFKVEVHGWQHTGMRHDSQSQKLILSLRLCNEHSCKILYGQANLIILYTNLIRIYLNCIANIFISCEEKNILCQPHFFLYNLLAFGRISNL